NNLINKRRQSNLRRQCALVLPAQKSSCHKPTEKLEDITETMKTKVQDFYGVWIFEPNLFPVGLNDDHFKDSRTLGLIKEPHS
ncbi:hypothetical protein AVEN_178201-1, partial [Araneus ventricosus]